VTYKKTKLYQLGYFWGYKVKASFSGKARKPLLCGFKITDRCNLSCGHCPFWGKERQQDMAWPKALRIMDRLYDDGVRLVVFEGGEPLLYRDDRHLKDISDIIKYAKKKFFITAVTTNGTIDFGHIDPDIIYVSIDGPREAHEKIRGKCFDMIMSNIEKAKHNKKMIANMTISSLNYKEVLETIEYLNEMVYGITVQFFYPYKGVADLSLDKVLKGEVLQKLLQKKKEGYRLLNSYRGLKAMMANSWRCHDFLVSTVEPDGIVSCGCYLKNRVEKISCPECGFAAHCEISLAYGLNPSSIVSAAKMFWGRS
jgi:Fe-coproporphyrin III synthase